MYKETPVRLRFLRAGESWCWSKLHKWSKLPEMWVRSVSLSQPEMSSTGLQRQSWRELVQLRLRATDGYSYWGPLSKFSKSKVKQRVFKFGCLVSSPSWGWRRFTNPTGSLALASTLAMSSMSEPNGSAPRSVLTAASPNVECLSPCLQLKVLFSPCLQLKVLQYII